MAKKASTQHVVKNDLRKEVVTQAQAVKLFSEAKTVRDKVLAAIKIAGKDGATTEQIEQRLDKSHQTVSARVNELKREGLIFDTGLRRKTKNGRNAAVMCYKRFEQLYPSCAMCGARRCDCDDIPPINSK